MSSSFSLWSAVAGAVISILVGILVQSYGLFFKRWIEMRDARHLTKRLERDQFTTTGFKKAAYQSSSIYIRPDCQDNEAFESNQLDKKRRPLFREIDNVLGPPAKLKCFLILADSGMGKSEFLLQYYRYHYASDKLAARFSLIVIPLNSSTADDLIKKVPIQSRDDSVLFLDALDEDNKAISDLQKRFSELISLTEGFHSVLITCRTQFLAADKALPEELETVSASGSLGLHGGPDTEIVRLYLSKLSDIQVNQYVRKRFPLWKHPLSRFAAYRTALRYKDLISRPLVLTFIQDLAGQQTAPKHSYEVYDIIVQKWLERESKKKRLASTPENLLKFSEFFACKLYAQGVPGLPAEQLMSTALELSIKLDINEIRERSLLNCLDGVWGFAHRSIMEYLLVRNAEKSSSPPEWVKLNRPWTDVMQRFAWEMILAGKHITYAKLDTICIQTYNIKNVSFTNVPMDGMDACGADFSKSTGISAYQAAVVRSDRKTIWPVRTFKGAVNDVLCCSVDAKRKLLLGCCSTGAIRAWDLVTTEYRWDFSVNSRINCCTVLPATGEYVFGAGKTAVVCGPSGINKKDFTQHTKNIISCFPVKISESAVISASAGEIIAWDTRILKKMHAFDSINASISCCTIQPNGNIVVAGTSDGHIGIWEMSSGTLLHKAKIAESEMTCCALSHDEEFILCGFRDRNVRISRSNFSEGPRIVGRHEGAVLCCSFLPNSDFFIYAGAVDDSIKIADWRSGKPRTKLTGHSNTVTSCISGYSEQGAIFSTSVDRTVRLWFG